MNLKIVQIGEIASDTGSLLMVDPGYMRLWEAQGFKENYGEDEDLPFDIQGAREAVQTDTSGAMLMKWVAAVVRTGQGDPGIYPVYAEYNRRGEVQRLIIRFLEDEPTFEYVPDAEVVPQPGEEPPAPVWEPEDKSVLGRLLGRGR